MCVLYVCVVLYLFILLSISDLTEPAYIAYLINKWLYVPRSCFDFLLLQK